MIGYNAQVTASNQIVLGTASETVRIPGRLGINQTAPMLSMDIGGTDSGFGRTRNYGSLHDADKRDGLFIGRWDGSTSGSPQMPGLVGEFCGMVPRVTTGAAVGEPYSNQAIISFYTWGNNIAGTRETFRINHRGSCQNTTGSYGSFSDEKIKENISTSKMYLTLYSNRRPIRAFV